MMTIFSSIAIALFFSLPNAQAPSDALKIVTVSSPESISVELRVTNPMGNDMQIMDVFFEVPEYTALLTNGGYFSVNSTSVAGFETESMKRGKLFLIRLRDQFSVIAPGESLSIPLGQIVDAGGVMHRQIGAVTLITDAIETRPVHFPMLFANSSIDAVGKVGFSPERRTFEFLEGEDGEVPVVPADATCNRITIATNKCATIPNPCLNKKNCRESGTWTYSTTLINCGCF